MEKKVRVIEKKAALQRPFLDFMKQAGEYPCCFLHII